MSIIGLFGTISKTRNLKEISKHSTIPYAKLASWESEAKSGKIEEKEYYTLFIIEYYRREEVSEVRKYIEEKNLQEDELREKIKGMIFPNKIYEEWKKSNIAWKRKTISDFSLMSKTLIGEQKALIEHAIFLRYGIPSPTLNIQQENTLRF